MNIIQLPVSELKIPKRNVRIHTETQLKEFERSVKMFGQIRPVVIDEENNVLAGNGLVETLKRMGIENADVFKMTGLSENQKKKLMIADNKIFSLGVENLDTLNSFFEEMKDDLDIPGFDEEILQSMVADADEITATLSEYGTLDEDEIQDLKDLGERKAEREERAESQQFGKVEQSGIPGKFEDSDNTSSAVEAQPEPEADRQFVICPKCGEKIWL